MNIICFEFIIMKYVGAIKLNKEFKCHFSIQSNVHDYIFNMATFYNKQCSAWINSASVGRRINVKGGDSPLENEG